MSKALLKRKMGFCFKPVVNFILEDPLLWIELPTTVRQILFRDHT